MDLEPEMRVSVSSTTFPLMCSLLRSAPVDTVATNVSGVLALVSAS